MVRYSVKGNAYPRVSTICVAITTMVSLEVKSDYLMQILKKRDARSTVKEFSRVAGNFSISKKLRMEEFTFNKICAHVTYLTIEQRRSCALQRLVTDDFYILNLLYYVSHSLSN